MTELDIEPAAGPTDADLRRVASLASLLADQTAVVASLTTALKAAQEALTATEERDLPEALLAVGYTPPSKPVIAGHTLEFKEDVRCGQLDDAPPKGKQQKRPLPERLAGLAWLEDEGFGDLIKHTLTIAFPRGMEVEAFEIESMIRAHRAANQLNIASARIVHAQTLSAFVREQGTYAVPMESLGASQFQRVKLKE